MNIFSIIVIYNGMRRCWIDNCFSSLASSVRRVRIIAIDNNSSDNSVEHIKKNYPDVILIENKENKGFGGANNQGLKLALELGGEFFFLLNQDAWIEKDTIEELVCRMKEGPGYGIVSPMHLNGEGTALDYNFSNYISPNYCKKLYSDFVLKKVENRIYESGFICAAAWMLSKECLRIVGGFSPVFYHYGEDDNYIHRLAFKGLKIGVLPSVSICHDREQRENSDFGNGLKKTLHLRFSDPAGTESIDSYLKSLKRRLIVNQILCRKPAVEQLREECQILKSSQTLIEETREKSMQHGDYLFL